MAPAVADLRARGVAASGPHPSDSLFHAGRALLQREADGTAFRLIGLGANPLLPGALADLPDLADPDAPRRVAAQRAMDALQGRFGDGVIRRGRGRGESPRFSAPGFCGIEPGDHVRQASSHPSLQVCAQMSS